MLEQTRRSVSFEGKEDVQMNKSGHSRELADNDSHQRAGAV